MKTNDYNDCCNCQKYFKISDGWNSEYCTEICMKDGTDERDKLAIAHSIRMSLYGVNQRKLDHLQYALKEKLNKKDLQILERAIMGNK
jgi:hypothetical protein